MQEIEVKSDESCALCIFKGETINGLPLNWLICWNKAVFEPFVLTRFFLVQLRFFERVSYRQVCLAFVPGRKISQKLAGSSYCYSLGVVRKTSTAV